MKFTYFLQYSTVFWCHLLDFSHFYAMYYTRKHGILDAFTIVPGWIHWTSKCLFHLLRNVINTIFFSSFAVIKYYCSLVNLRLTGVYSKQQNHNFNWFVSRHEYFAYCIRKNQLPEPIASAAPISRPEGIIILDYTKPSFLFLISFFLFQIQY